MNNVDNLKQYAKKNAKYKQLEARLKTIRIELENIDKLEASGGVNGTAYAWEDDGQVKDAVIMPYERNTEHGDVIGNIIVNREAKQMEQLMLEIELAHLSEWIINIDSMLECMGHEERWILNKMYIEGYYADKKNRKGFKYLLELYNKEMSIMEGSSLGNVVRSIKAKFNQL